jgi:hypothetical protein
MKWMGFTVGRLDNSKAGNDAGIAFFPGRSLLISLSFIEEQRPGYSFSVRLPLQSYF